MAMVTTESSESPPPTSFSSLPEDITLNILARISRIHHPTLSLVSKTFQTTLASRELHVTRTLLGKKENCFYLYFKHRWFITTEQQKLMAIPLCPFEYPENPTVVSTGSEIYIIGGFIKGESISRSRNVFILDCRSHEWRRLPDMLFPRANSVTGLIQGKIYVFGGCDTPCFENRGERYDPKTQSWEPLSPTTFTLPDLKFQKSMTTRMTYCFVGEEKIWCRASEYTNLQWCDLEDNLGWREVKGIEKLPIFSHKFISVANSGGRKVTVWCFEEACLFYSCDVKVWCAEISFERRSREELFGVVEWCKVICILDLSDAFILICNKAPIISMLSSF